MYTPLLFPLFILLALCSIYVSPEQPDILPPSVSEDLPVGWRLMGWYGVKTQETEKERTVLSPDTKFSKAIYTNVDDPIFVSVETEGKGTVRRPLPCMVSVVFSGNDMNNSIHRPERCLPAQGHLDLRSREMSLRLKDGHVFPFTRLSSITKTVNGETIHHIHYYVFVGDSIVTENHIWRTLYDIRDRIFSHKVQRWAYIQLSAYYGDVIGVNEKTADAQLIKLIQGLLPQVIDWQRVQVPQKDERKDEIPAVPEKDMGILPEQEPRSIFREVLEM